MSYNMIHEAGINVLEWPSDEESWTGSMTEAQQEFRGDCRWIVVPLQESCTSRAQNALVGFKKLGNVYLRLLGLLRELHNQFYIVRIKP